MQSITGVLMMENREIALIGKNSVFPIEEALLPLQIKRTGNLEAWLASRAIDRHRTNSRLLKKILRLTAADDAEVAMAVNAATLTDRYWVRPEGSELQWEDVRFSENYFDKLALHGDPDAFFLPPSRTPELTNTGSYEKCWRSINGEWWLYKSGNEMELFSEMFICRLGEKSGLSMAHYEFDDGYIRSRDFVDNTGLFFEPMASLTDANDNYADCFDALRDVSEDIAKQYLQLIWMDSVCFNVDRHTENFGVLRSVESGQIVALAPNFDNNIALISMGYPKKKDREGDGLIKFLADFVNSVPRAAELYRKTPLPRFTRELVQECFDEIPISVDEDFIADFILNGQRVVNEKLFGEAIAPSSISRKEKETARMS